jgi:TPR repeat protein
MAATDITVTDEFKKAKELYAEEKYPAALNECVSVIKAKKREGRGTLRLTEEEASFLWTSAENQFQLQNYPQAKQFYQQLFQDKEYVKAHPDHVVIAGVKVAYGPPDVNQRDYPVAVGFFSKVIEYAAGTFAAAKAKKDLGFMHENGHGVAADANKALSLYKASAEEGYPEGCYCFGLHHYNLYLNQEAIEASALQQASDSLNIAKEWLGKARTLGYIAPPHDSNKLVDCLKHAAQVDGQLSDYYHSLSVQATKRQTHAELCLDSLAQSSQMAAISNLSAQPPVAVDPMDTQKPEVIAAGPLEAQEPEKKEEQPANSSATTPAQKGPGQAAALKEMGMFKKTPPPASTPKKGGEWQTAGRGRGGRGRG